MSKETALFNNSQNTKRASSQREIDTTTDVKRLVDFGIKYQCKTGIGVDGDAFRWEVILNHNKLLRPECTCP